MTVAIGVCLIILALLIFGLSASRDVLAQMAATGLLFVGIICLVVPIFTSAATKQKQPAQAVKPSRP